MVSIAGGSVEEYAELATRLAGEPGVAALEVNISCPNVANRGLVFACDPGASREVVAAVVERTPAGVPVLAKLSPDVTDVVAVAAACLDGGAHGLSAINTLLGLVVDTDTLRPQLAGTTGGLSGPAIRAVAVRVVWQLVAAMRAGAIRTVPVIGIGGVRTGPRRPAVPGRRRVRRAGRHRRVQRPVRLRARRPRARRRPGGPRHRAGRGRRRRRPHPEEHPVTETAATTGPGGSPVPFGTRLRAATDEHGPLCVGIDPHPGLLHAWGLDDDADGLERFAMTCVEALAGSVAVVKPQSAFFERHGSRGVAVLEQVVGHLRTAGTLTIVDAKRGDIGSTMAAYADAYAGEGSTLAGDAVTVSPYLGFGSLRPLLDLAHLTGRGVFVLGLTSNPEGAEVQHATSDGRPLASVMVEHVRDENARTGGDLGSVGLVVGATVGPGGRAARASTSPPAAAPCSPRASAPRAAPRPAWPRCSARRAGRCCRRRRGRCWPPDRTSPPCAPPPAAPPRSARPPWPDRRSTCRPGRRAGAARSFAVDPGVARRRPDSLGSRDRPTGGGRASPDPSTRGDHPWPCRP